jgi:hypothetical protein
MSARLAALLGISVALAAACAPAEEQQTEQTADLTAAHRVDDYQAEREKRVLDHAVQGHDFRGEIELAAGEALLIMRSMVIDGTPSYVVADDSFRLSIVDAAELDGASHADAGATSKYDEALERTRHAVLCQLESSSAAADGQRFALTVDMCQSSRPWERELYQWAVSLSEQLGEPVKIGVAMTGGWAKQHESELGQLLNWQREGKLDITWINHSARHQLSRDSDGHYHFLTADSIDMSAAVLDLESLLLGQGVMFSALFRFPGLTHDERTLAELNDLSLFPLDANGWLAKGQPLSDGSVVLLHGNGNEPPGIDMFMRWAEDNDSALRNGQAQLGDARETLPLSGDIDAMTPCAP